jgi:hypothetical protein
MEIKEVYKEIKEVGDPVTIKLIHKLIDCLINQRREMNDTAEGNDIFKNQGAIISMKDLKTYSNK